jgi:putative copper export protein
MHAQLLLTFAKPAQGFVQSAASFLTAGAIGFRFSALRGRLIEADHNFFFDAARKAAVIGLIGLAITIVLTLTGLPVQAARAHMDAMTFATTDTNTMLRLAMLLLTLLGLALAAADIRAGWLLALVGLLGGALRSIFTGQWDRLLTPIHVLAAGLWLGTLFVLVTAGLSALFRHEQTRERRGAIAADMVNGFSPLALTMGGVVVLMGVILAWQNLTAISDFWTTNYGIALLVKLVFVACVFGLGAWNWRKQRPLLGSEGAAHAIRRSARAEIAFAVIVLIVTAIMATFPSPSD